MTITPFVTKVDRRSRKAMTDFLTGHFRYHTMNGWNQATSYANDMKVHHLLPEEVQDRAWEVMEVDDWQSEAGIDFLIDEFAEEHGWSYQAGWNGRSSGYLVLYTGGRKRSEYKRRCGTCGQRNFKAETTVCGYCHATNMHDYTGWEVFAWPGKGFDQDGDFHEWSMTALRERVELVTRFDRLCDDIVAATISLCEHFTVEDETVLVPTPIKILVET